jgi:zinc transport system substrate-binding protein
MKGGPMNKKLISRILAVLLLASVFTLLACSQPSDEIDVMAGSSLIANIVQDVAGDTLTTRSLIPADTCPGHYDIKPSDIIALGNCTALFIHDYQQYFANINDAVAAADNPSLSITVLNVTGNWMVPAVQAEAVSAIAQALEELYPENAAYYQQRAADREQAILDHGDDVENELQDAGVEGVNVICAEMQQGFVAWAGFNVTATFGRPEDLSPADLAQLVEAANQTGAALIIDNLQSGSTTLGATIGGDVDAIPVTISNFPGGLPNTETWEKAIDKNVDLLLNALNEWQEQYG